MLITMVYLLMVIVIVFVKYIKDNNIEGSNITVFFIKKADFMQKETQFLEKDLVLKISSILYL